MKNIHILTINMMLNTTERWLADDGFRKVLEAAGPLGVGILQELTKAHEPLAQLENKRGLAKAQLRTLIGAAGTLDSIHDRKARSLHHHVRGLIEGTDDEAKANEYRALEGLLFPEGLRVVQLPYIEEGGAAVALERAVSPEIRAKLAATVVGEQTLDDLFSAWITAGHELGTAVEQRAELKASLGRSGSAVGEIDLNIGRSRWIKAVRGLLWAIDITTELQGISERVHATLDEAISARLRGRDSGGGRGEGLPEEDSELGGEGPALDDEQDFAADADADADVDADTEVDEDEVDEDEVDDDELDEIGE